MNYDDDEGRDEPRSRTGRRHDDGHPASIAEPEAQTTDERASNRGVSDEDRAIRPTSNEIDPGRAIDGEFADDDSPQQFLRSVVAQWTGDLPHPGDAERYEAICPGTLTRLIALNERRMDVVEQEVQISKSREAAVRSAIDAEGDVNRSLAAADTKALTRGQWLSWSISVACIAAVVLGLCLGYPQALWALGVPVVQAGVSLVRTVTQSRDKPRQHDREPDSE